MNKTKLILLFLLIIGGVYLYLESSKKPIETPEEKVEQQYTVSGKATLTQCTIIGGETGMNCSSPKMLVNRDIVVRNKTTFSKGNTFGILEDNSGSIVTTAKTDENGYFPVRVPAGDFSIFLKGNEYTKVSEHCPVFKGQMGLACNFHVSQDMVVDLDFKTVKIVDPLN